MTSKAFIALSSLMLCVLGCDQPHPPPYQPAPPPVYEQPVYPTHVPEYEPSAAPAPAPAVIAPAPLPPAAYTPPVVVAPAPPVYVAPPPVVVAPAPRPVVIVAPRPVYSAPVYQPSWRSDSFVTRRTVTTYRTEDKVGAKVAPAAPVAAKVVSPMQMSSSSAGGLRGAAQQTGGTFSVDTRAKPAATAFGAMPSSSRPPAPQVSAPRPSPAPPPRPVSFGTTAVRPPPPAPRPTAPTRSSAPSFGTTATRRKP